MISNRDSRRRNSRLVVAFTILIIIPIIAWTAGISYIRQDRANIIAMYTERQHAIVSYSLDIIELAIEKGGFLVRALIEDYIAHGSDPTTQRDPSRPGNKRSNYQDYQNFINYYDGKPVHAVGFLKNNYKRVDGALKENGSELDKAIQRQIALIKLKKPKNEQFSSAYYVHGRHILMTTGRFPMFSKDAYVTTYADQNRILNEFGFFKRRRITLGLAFSITLIMLSFSVFLARTHLRERENSERQEENTRALLLEIEERKQAEAEKDRLREQLLQSQKMDAIGTLAGGIAHDFNNLMTVALGNAEMGLMRVPAGAPGRNEIEQIKNATLLARDLTMKIITFARREKLVVKTMPAEEIITGGLFTILSRSMPKRIRIETSFTPLPAPVRVDPAQIVQALVNVCTNARESMPDGGVLRIGIHEAACPDHLRAQFPDAPDNFCAITVADTGAGMPRETVAKIFEPFFTTKDMGQGTGLGMSITHSIIRNHDGHIEVNSQPGSGTTVVIYLPFAKDEPVKEELPNSAGPQGRPAGILVVDDDPDVLDVTMDILRNEGCRVFTAPGGDQALKTYSANRDAIDLILLDIIMPDMDGREVFTELKKFDPGCRVLLYSGYSLDGQADELLADPCIQGFLQKPFKMAELIAHIRRIAGPGKVTEGP